MKISFECYLLLWAKRREVHVARPHPYQHKVSKNNFSILDIEMSKYLVVPSVSLGIEIDKLQRRKEVYYIESGFLPDELRHCIRKVGQCLFWAGRSSTPELSGVF